MYSVEFVAAINRPFVDYEIFAMVAPIHNFFQDSKILTLFSNDDNKNNSITHATTLTYTVADDGAPTEQFAINSSKWHISVSAHFHDLSVNNLRLFEEVCRHEAVV